ncbi:MAG: hypothetical protein ACXAC5_01985 [Promethearchaeota archaeon]
MVSLVTVYDAHDYGNALPRGLVVHEGEVWIVTRNAVDDYWHLSIKVSDAKTGNAKYRNYLRRILRWPWSEQDTKEIMG